MSAHSQKQTISILKRFVSMYVVPRRTVMEQRLSMITLGVADLKRAVAFYEKVIGWKAAPKPFEVAFLISAESCFLFARTMTWRRT